LTSTLPIAAIARVPKEGIDLIFLEQKLDALNYRPTPWSLNAIIALEVECRRADADAHLAE